MLESIGTTKNGMEREFRSEDFRSFGAIGQNHSNVMGNKLIVCNRAVK